MQHKKQHDQNPQSGITTEIEVQYTLDVESLETAKKLEKKIFDRMINKDLDIIKKHKIKK